MPRIILPADAHATGSLFAARADGTGGARSLLQGMHNGFGRKVNPLQPHTEMNADRRVMQIGEPLAISTPVESVWSSPQDKNATPSN